MDYMPVSRKWQHDRCQSFGLELRRNWLKDQAEPVPITITQAPASTVRIVGDGNCFFRALSHVITGSQEDHHILQLMVVSVRRENTLLLGSVLDSKESMSSYLERTGMETPTVWATEVELFAAATMLNTVIYTYAPAGPVYTLLTLPISLQLSPIQNQTCRTWCDRHHRNAQVQHLSCRCIVIVLLWCENTMRAVECQ